MSILLLPFGVVQNFNVVAQNISGALHLADALHRESTLETRTATHLKENAVQFYLHDFEQLPFNR